MRGTIRARFKPKIQKKLVLYYEEKRKNKYDPKV